MYLFSFSFLVWGECCHLVAAGEDMTAASSKFRPRKVSGAPLVKLEQATSSDTGDSHEAGGHVLLESLAC